MCVSLVRIRLDTLGYYFRWLFWTILTPHPPPPSTLMIFHPAVFLALRRFTQWIVEKMHTTFQLSIYESDSMSVCLYLRPRYFLDQYGSTLQWSFLYIKGRFIPIFITSTLRRATSSYIKWAGCLSVCVCLYLKKLQNQYGSPLHVNLLVRFLKTIYYLYKKNSPKK